MVYLLFSEILTRSTTANCWLINSFDCFPSVLWRHRVFDLNCWPVNSFDCFPRTFIIVKLKKLNYYHICKNYWLFPFFSSIDQVIKQLFHLWFGNSQTAVPLWRGYCLFSACMAAVKCRPVLHHCVVIFLVPRDHGVYMYVVYIWKWSSAHALWGVIGVASFITTDEQLR